MRERLTTKASATETPAAIARETRPTFEHVKKSSLLKGPAGETAEVHVAIITEPAEHQGELRHVNFWDLDKTLLLAEPIHAKAVEQIFPEFAKTEEARAELHKVYFAGFKLGNSFREWDRMWRIYGEGQEKYKDHRVYEAEFLGKDNPKRRIIDEPGHAEGFHERANNILQRYGKIAYDFMAEEYKADPEGFSQRILKPEIVQLLIEKTKLGQVSVFMTANQADFARGLVAFSGLWKYGLALATDETMAGGGKEIAIRTLFGQLEEMGLTPNKDECTAIGDSILGDVGSGVVEGLGNGVVITETHEDIAAILARGADSNPDQKDREAIQRTLDGKTKVVGIATKSMEKNKNGLYPFGKSSSQKKK